MAEEEEVAAVEEQLPFPLEQCTVHRQRGQCYTVTCLIYGWGSHSGKTATLHKLIYGHYLRFPKLDIAKCIPLDRIEANHPKFYASLDARRAHHASIRLSLYERWLAKSSTPQLPQLFIV